MKGRRAAVLACLAPVVLSSAAAAQALPQFPAALADSQPAHTGFGVDSALWRRKPWVRPVSSLLVPGSGQLLAGQARGVVYLAAEIWLVSRALAYDHQGDVQAGQYKQMAYDVARRQFSSVRVDGPFEYYETMEKYVESGVYDSDPSPFSFVPEQDTVTYNGSVWALARRTFFVNPDSLPDPSSQVYRDAIEFYREHAWGDDFRWSWRGARLEQDVFRGSIRASDDAFRRRTNYLGALVLNHVASAIDALISVRASRAAPAVPRMEFQANPQSASLVWTGSFRGPKL